MVRKLRRMGVVAFAALLVLGSSAGAWSAHAESASDGPGTAYTESAQGSGADVQGSGADVQGSGADVQNPGAGSQDGAGMSGNSGVPDASENLSGQMPNPDLHGPKISMGTDYVEVPGGDAENPGGDLEGPKVDLEGPKVDLEGPKVDLESPKVESGAGSLRIFKYTKATIEDGEYAGTYKRAIPGVEFVVQDVAADGTRGANYSRTFTTWVEGVAELEFPAAGRYVITEVTPSGYKALTGADAECIVVYNGQSFDSIDEHGPWSLQNRLWFDCVTVSEFNSMVRGEEVTISQRLGNYLFVENEPKVEVGFAKVDEDGLYLEGAQLALYKIPAKIASSIELQNRKDNRYDTMMAVQEAMAASFADADSVKGFEKVAEWTSEEKLHMQELDYGYYAMVELKAPAGYLLTNRTILFQVVMDSGNVNYRANLYSLGGTKNQKFLGVDDVTLDKILRGEATDREIAMFMTRQREWYMKQDQDIQNRYVMANAVDENYVPSEPEEPGEEDAVEPKEENPEDEDTVEPKDENPKDEDTVEPKEETPKDEGEQPESPAPKTTTGPNTGDDGMLGFRMGACALALLGVVLLARTTKHEK